MSPLIGVGTLPSCCFSDELLAKDPTSIYGAVPVLWVKAFHSKCYCVTPSWDTWTAHKNSPSEYSVSNPRAPFLWTVDGQQSPLWTLERTKETNQAEAPFPRGNSTLRMVKIKRCSRSSVSRTRAKRLELLPSLSTNLAATMRGRRGGDVPQSTDMIQTWVKRTRVPIAVDRSLVKVRWYTCRGGAALLPAPRLEEKLPTAGQRQSGQNGPEHIPDALLIPEGEVPRSRLMGPLSVWWSPQHPPLQTTSYEVPSEAWSSTGDATRAVQFGTYFTPPSDRSRLEPAPFQEPLHINLFREYLSHSHRDSLSEGVRSRKYWNHIRLDYSRFWISPPTTLLVVFPYIDYPQPHHSAQRIADYLLRV
ncbi:hypothetical protein M427DRAFT_45129 [Gonapodya prolifera JEL478]|uniref:Uncharacterized protein n=1 Tax=Gonapodya prolifera (strain JEL478) TaxID=1344416 RepID=A0A139AD01_GONPJ|nr:hypothetical protein M427DRAFT_45129 [Gonapodya prolifera JEL478]|eukprot:KXS14293.1 hypothetical protein M427DRAFT_45129 [Gonapodya prolifera JEL478]